MTFLLSLPVEHFTLSPIDAAASETTVKRLDGSATRHRASKSTLQRSLVCIEDYSPTALDYLRAHWIVHLALGPKHSEQEGEEHHIGG